MTRRTLLCSFAATPLLGQKADAVQIEKIRTRLAALPLYGCFDFLTFRLVGTVVTLAGYTISEALKADAVAAIQSIVGITKVENEIEILPDSPTDDQVRSGISRSFNLDPALRIYAPGGQYFGGPFYRRAGGAFFGAHFERWLPAAGTFEPLGVFPIHIVMKQGNVVLVGVVDSAADASRANLLANGVARVSNVKNLLELAPTQFTKFKKAK